MHDYSQLQNKVTPNKKINPSGDNAGLVFDSVFAPTVYFLVEHYEKPMRDGFPKSVKDKLARRVGWRRSNAEGHAMTPP